MKRKPQTDEGGNGSNIELPPLPQSWCWVPLDALAEATPNAITDGPFGSNLKTSHYTSAGPRVIRLQNIGDGEFVDEYAHISQEHFASLSKHAIHAGDLTIAALGETLPRSCVIPSWVGPAIVKADCPRFKPDVNLVVSEFVNFALNSPETRRRTSSIIHGVGRPRLTLSEIRGIRLPLAPLNEQRRIVAKIEELFSNLDAGVAALERIRANLKRYRASVLKAAVEGRLTEAWRAKHPNTEPASKLLERILAERRQKWEEDQLAKFTAADRTPPKGWREKYVESAAPDTSGVSELPQGWMWVTLSQVASVERGKFQHRPRNEPRFYGGSYPFVQIGELPRDGGHITSYKRTLNEEGLRISRLFPKGTVLIAIVGATIANTGILSFDSCTPDSLVAIQSPQNYLSAFIDLYLRSRKLAIRLMGYASGGQPNINLETLTPLPMPLPQDGEIQAIIEEVERRLSIIEEAEAQADANLIRAARLRQCILKRAFEGKLVPQDPTDEPASALLDRIKQQRASSAKAEDGKMKTGRKQRDSGTSRDQRN